MKHCEFNTKSSWILLSSDSLRPGSLKTFTDNLMLLFSSNSQLKGSLYGVHPLATSAASAGLRGGLCDNESEDDKTQTPTQRIYGEVLRVNSPTTGSSQATTHRCNFLVWAITAMPLVVGSTVNGKSKAFQKNISAEKDGGRTEDGHWRKSDRERKEDAANVLFSTRAG